MNKLLPLILIILLAGCASGPPAVYGELKIVHQVQPWTDWMIQDERSWMGNNPRIHGELGLEFDHNITCAFVTGTSLFTGAPFHEKSPAQPQQELYWANFECGKRFYIWGRK